MVLAGVSAGPVLVVNTGSTSLRLSIVDGQEALAARRLETPADPAAVIEDFLRSAPQPAAVGHRVVHGGERFRKSTAVDSALEAALDDLSELAPLHNPPAVAAIRALAEVRPDLPAVACFDTAFHATLPPAAATYALPEEWRERWPLRRYGFHGLSHAWVARRVQELAAKADRELRIVSCHLGAGGSLAAIVGRRSIDTTMGFTPLEGLVMATRAGSVDPGLLLWLIRRRGLDADDVEDGLERHSGLFGLAGSADMRAIEESAEAGDERAELAVEVYCHRLRAAVAAMAAALGGIDWLVFTGGVGEHSPGVRARTMTPLVFLGIDFDEVANADASADALISAADSRVAVAVVESREDLEIAAETRAVLGWGSVGHG